MKVEFFPPREEIILVNEAPSEFYIVVNGSAVSQIFLPLGHTHLDEMPQLARNHL